VRATVLSLVLLASVAVTTSQPVAQPAEVPSHVKTWIYYGASDMNDSVPAAYIAAHAYFAESADDQPELINRFKAAGGRYSVMYTDPAFIPHCVPPFSPPAGVCKGPIGNGNLPESAWLHGPDGQRVHRADDYTHQYQEMLNPASPAARGAYEAFTKAAVSRARVDVFFADDSGSPLKGPDGSPMSGAFYRFNAAAVELPDDSRFVAGIKGMLASAVRPVVINGAEPDTYRPAYDGALIDGPNVIGELVEGCFLNDSSRAPLAGDTWRKMADGQIAVTRHHKYAVCMMQGEGLKDPLERLYGLASWWLTYDPQWSVIAPVSPGTDGKAVFSEEDIVPAEPLRATDRGLEAFRVGNLYVREFRRCYERGVAIGGCATVVNPTLSTVPVPELRQRYRSSLSLSSKSAYGGGSNVWSTNVPKSLGGNQAAILRT
jgi:hypothetical protein